MIGGSSHMPDSPEISVVVPVRNEEGSVAELARRLREILPVDHEILFIDDGSTDATWKRLVSLHDKNRVRLVKFRGPCGKSAALMEGFARCRAPVIFTIDGDLQDDPSEIPSFLAKFQEGYDLVSGWKRHRRDPLHKVIASRAFNFVMRHSTGLGLHDMNCGFKCYSAALAKALRIYGDQHRFIPVFAAQMGYRVGEVEVRHQPRIHGRSKYGLSRLLTGPLDLGTVLLRTRYRDRPAHAFGLVAVALALGSAALLATTLTRALHPAWASTAVAMAILLGVSAAGFLACGWLAEFLLHSSNGKSEPPGPQIEEARD